MFFPYNNPSKSKRKTMSSYLVGQVSVKNQKLWEEYVSGVKESLVPYESNIVFRGKRTEVVVGENPRNLIVVIEFKDHPTLQSWYRSVKYQSLVELRDSAADLVITFYDEY